MIWTRAHLLKGMRQAEIYMLPIYFTFWQTVDIKEISEEISYLFFTTAIGN